MLVGIENFSGQSHPAVMPALKEWLFRTQSMLHFVPVHIPFLYHVHVSAPYPSWTGLDPMQNGRDCIETHTHTHHSEARDARTTINSVQTRCIVKGEAQKSPLFW